MSDPQPSAPSRKPMIVAGIALVVVVALGTGWYLLRGRGEQPASEPVTPPPAAPAPTAPPPQEAPQTQGPPLPALDQSDAHVREQLGRLSSDPEFQRWLGIEGIIRRITAATSNVAEGESPRAVLAFLAPQGPFQVVERTGHTLIAPESFARYDPVVNAIRSLDTQAAAGAYKALKPLFDQAFGEIGRPGQRFDATLSRAIQRLLDTPVPEGELEVVATPSVNYAYSAPELEQLSAAQKHLLRMGPTNARALQAKLRELREAMGLPAAGH
jgi:DUF3014 family protein